MKNEEPRMRTAGRRRANWKSGFGAERRPEGRDPNPQGPRSSGRFRSVRARSEPPEGSWRHRPRERYQERKLRGHERECKGNVKKMYEGEERRGEENPSSRTERALADEKTPLNSEQARRTAGPEQRRGRRDTV